MRASIFIRLYRAVLVMLLAMLVAVVGASASPVTLELVWVDEDQAVLVRRDLSISEVEAIEEAEVATSTPWTEGVLRFTGPTLASLAALEDGVVATARLQALNDYSIEVSAKDWEAYNVVLASRVDGELMRVRDHRPLWLVYPLDDHPELRTQRYHSQMIWQTTRIIFLVDG